MKELRRLLAFLKPFLGWVTLSVLAGVATLVSNIALLGTSAYLIAQAALHPSIALLQVAIVGVRFFGILRGIFRYLERLASHSVNFRLLARLRVWFYQKIEPLVPARLIHRQSGDLLIRAIGDIETLENFYVRAVSPVIVAIVVTAGMGLFLRQYSPALARVLVGGLLLSGIVIPLLSDWLNRTPGKRWIETRAALSSAVVEFIQGMADLKANNAEASVLTRTIEYSRLSAQAQRRSLWSGAFTGAANQFLSLITLWGVMFVAIPLVSDGSLEGIFLAVLVLVTLASFEAVTPLAQAAQHWQSSRHAAARLFEIADAPLAVYDPEAPLPAPEGMALRVERLTFSYDPQMPPALQDVTFTCAPGMIVAVVGPSGSGKTTLMNCLLRFWDVPAGTLWLDGHDVRQYRAEDVRRRIAVVSQNTYLFNATLRQNLLMAKPGTNDDDLLRVLEQVSLVDWLKTLPEGLDTWLGERGLNLSGGERQRLALARVLLQDAPLVILDEPTANLDAVTEMEILAMIHQTLEKRSIIWVTHRLVGLECVDQILVLNNGQIVESGTEAELIQQNGDYARIKRMQVRLLE